MSKKVTRRGFFKGTLLAIAGSIPLLTSCVAPRVSPNAGAKDNGKPWRCSNCGHLTRSHSDLSGDRCPRCYSKQLKQITEEEFAEYLKKETANH